MNRPPKTREYRVTLSNGTTLRIIATDFRKAYNRGCAWGKKQEPKAIVTDVNEIV